MKQIWSALAISFLTLQSPVSGAQIGSDSVRKPPTLTQVWGRKATYSDPEHGVTFRYPSVWRPSTQFGYWPPALEGAVAPPIAGFGFRTGSFPRAQDEKGSPYSSTNVEGFGIVYSVISATTAARCTEAAASLAVRAGHRIAVFGGQSFVVYETGQGGMSQSTEGKLYAGYTRQTCYLFETNLALSEGAVDGPDGISALTSAQRRFIEAQLLTIVKSVRIMPNGR